MRNFMIIFMLIFSSIVFADGIALEGTLVLKDNTTIPIDGFTLFNNLDDYYITCEYNNTEIKILLSKIKRLDVLTGVIGRYGRNNKVNIELRDGKLYNVSNASINFESWSGGYTASPIGLQYRTFDAINEKIIENTIDCKDLKSIILEKIGDVSIDPSTGQKFPPDYRYNPYTGNKLEPGNFRE